MLKNMVAEIEKNNYSHDEMAVMLGITKTELAAKIQGKTGFSVREILILRNVFFQECSLEYLLKTCANE